ncbi:DsbA family protein [Desulfoluna spongiiphila]|uniref:DSBA-like thioredoxin domain-containing protein n=1 Tax=Desulfoluna spongiiphila TaxID=419481 RepID=A0A1G5HN73_9BACT|nr:DsbA family protein [Desulfoluna spongiiphila]SCY65154.1 putative protein-disulfide isomerase [Desulfoluna spongiiphila]
MSRTTDKEIIYVGDPMCAWCFGFEPVLDALMERFESTVPFRFIMGGLRVEDPFPITEALKPKLLENWQGVTRTTGQTINGHLLADAPGFLYDSAPASRAFVAVRRLNEALALPYYRALHHAFYLEMKDITQAGVLCGLAAGIGVSPDQFTRLAQSESVRLEAQNDFDLARDYNAQAFPALVLKEGPHASVLNQGYKELSALTGILDDWIKGDLPTSEITPALLIFGRAS